jgi:hypothetical protein
MDSCGAICLLLTMFGAHISVLRVSSGILLKIAQWKSFAGIIQREHIF